MTRGKYNAEVTMRLPLTVYADGKEEARMAAYRIAHSVVAKCGAGQGTVMGIIVQRAGSGHDEYLPQRRTSARKEGN